MRDAFRAYSCSRGIPAQRVRSPLPGDGLDSATVLFPGMLAGIPAYTAKVHAKFPASQPAIRGLILLHDLATGELLAVMDSTYLTAVRTALAATTAADVLARSDARRVAIIGAGVQGEWQARLLPHVRRIERIDIYDTVAGKAEALAARLRSELTGIHAQPQPELKDAVRGAELIATATWAREPFLSHKMIDPGTHITTLGADEPGKCELSEDLIRAGLFVCDDRGLALTMGAVAGAGLGPEAIHAELADILAGVHTGRTHPEEITIYGGVGLAWQDLVVAWDVFQKAKSAGAGLKVDFLG